MAEPEFIKLDQFLKIQQIVITGGEAKLLIRSQQVIVNDEVETRRGRKLYQGDVVQVFERTIPVEFE